MIMGTWDYQSIWR